MRGLAFLICCLFAGLGTAVAANPVPFVNQPLVPADAAPGGGAFTLTVNGTGFVSGATVNWNGRPLSTVFVSPSQLTAAVSAALIAAPNTASVTVTNPGTGAASNVVYFPIAQPRSQLAFTSALASPITLGTPTTPHVPMAIAAADFNGDGKLDLAVALLGNPSVLQVLLGNGNGTFAVVPTQATVGMRPTAVAVSDFNGDGKPDLAVLNAAPAPNEQTTPDIFNSVSVLLGNGDGTFTNAPGSPVSVGFDPIDVAVADFNGDGKLDLAVLGDGIDLVTGNNVDATLTILLGNGDGTFTPAPGSPVDLGIKILPSALAVGDFNGDGKLDLAIANFATSTVTILLGNGDGTFTQAPGSPVTLTVTVEPEVMAAGDFTGNGKLDLAVGGSYGYSIDTLLGNGDGTFTEQTTCCGIIEDTGTMLTALSPFAMEIGDFYGDGHLDLAMGLEWINTSFVTFVHGNGDANPVFTRSDYSTLTYDIPASVAVGDFNNDGELDVVTGADPSSQIAVQLQMPSQQSPDFAIASTGNSTATVSPGGTATYSGIQISSLNGFIGDVSFSCFGQPVNATCSASVPSAFIVAESTATVTLTVQTTAPTQGGVALPVAGPGRWIAAPLAALLALMCIATVGRIQPRRIPRRVRVLAPLGVLLVSVVLLATCGSGGASGSSGSGLVGGTPAGTYQIVVEGTWGQIVHSTTVTLTVK